MGLQALVEVPVEGAGIAAPGDVRARARERASAEGVVVASESLVCGPVTAAVLEFRVIDDALRGDVAPRGRPSEEVLNEHGRAEEAADRKGK